MFELYLLGSEVKAAAIGFHKMRVTFDCLRACHFLQGPVIHDSLGSSVTTWDSLRAGKNEFRFSTNTQKLLLCAAPRPTLAPVQPSLQLVSLAAFPLIKWPERELTTSFLSVRMLRMQRALMKLHLRNMSVWRTETYELARRLLIFKSLVLTFCTMGLTLKSSRSCPHLVFMRSVCFVNKERGIISQHPLHR